MTNSFDSGSEPPKGDFEGSWRPSKKGDGTSRELDPIDDTSSTERPSRKAAFIFGIGTALGVAFGLIAVLAFAAFDHPYRAAVLLGSGTILTGVLRGIWPGRPWFASRKRWLDVVVYVLVGALILYLAPWTSMVAVG